MMEGVHEQITKVPADLQAVAGNQQAGTGRVKNPKKVAAGKALARRNKEAREAQKMLEEMKAAPSVDARSLSFSDVNGMLLSAAGVAGGCLTLYHAYKLFFPEARPDERPNAIAEEEPKPVPPPLRDEEDKGNLIDME